MISRLLKEKILQRMEDEKVLIFFGPRQVGKTTLLKSIQKEIDKSTVWWNGDEPDIRNQLQDASSRLLDEFIGNNDLLIIDEAQRIENIGLILKLIKDNIPDVKVIATGSSSFDLANKINEPLTGRKWEFFLYPLSTEEMINEHGLLDESRLLKHRLVYGYYPEVVTSKGQEAEILNQLASSYLYKDILTWEQIQKPAKLEKLVQALAFQVGQQVSINEVAQTAGLDFHTVSRYIDLLEKAYIIFQLQPFSRNLKNEIKKSRKIYFYDNGIRNAVINQFNGFDLRQDKGALWENYLMSERKKFLDYHNQRKLTYFWRNHAQQEIDYLEEANAEIEAFEFKWNPNAKAKFSKSFTNEYQPKVTRIIHQDNYLDFIRS
ncbi:MAG: ATP-binding protein [Gracilimonas sp.]|nr:ATP-binding protein [Gracilimonas sp.]